MLQTYKTIFLKPNYGSGGSGIIRIRKRTLHSGFEIRSGRYRQYVGFDGLRKYLQRLSKSTKRFIVQRGIKLARYKGRKFDIRVYLQKPEHEWMISGMVARVAAQKLVVTNHSKGGFARTVDRVLAYLFDGDRSRTNACIREIENLSLTIAPILKRKFSDLRELGIDIAIDENGRVWFIEANSLPGHHLFTQLPDKSMLRTIKANKRKMR